MMSYYGDWGNGYSMMNWTGSGFIWNFMMIFFWVLAITALFLFIKWLSEQNRNGNKAGNGKTANEILEDRYAKGEIGREEFLKIKKDLNGS